MSTAMLVIITTVVGTTLTTISLLAGVSIHREFTHLQRKHLRRREREVAVREYQQDQVDQRLDDALRRVGRPSA